MKISLPATLLSIAALVVVGSSWHRAEFVRGTNKDRAGGLVRPAAAAGQAAATSFDNGEPLSNRDLTIQSEAIIVGRAAGTQPFWTADGRNLFTLVTISVEETLKGDGASSITVALPGGVDANRKFPIAVNYPGAPRISPDEEVLLFLVGADDEVAGSYAVAGFSQGKFSISSGGGGTGFRVQGAERKVRVGDTLMSLSAFKDEIRSYLAQ
jgi:hypothetical protein